MEHKKTFEHNFKMAFGVVDIRGIFGYTQCLQSLYKYLAETTHFDPTNRYIDAVPLLDMISATNAELAQLLADEQKGLNEDLQIMSAMEIVEKRYPEELKSHEADLLLNRKLS